LDTKNNQRLKIEDAAILGFGVAPDKKLR